MNLPGFVWWFGVVGTRVWGLGVICRVLGRRLWGAVGGLGSLRGVVGIRVEALGSGNEGSIILM